MYAKITAFFMTGTGNSYKVAAWFAAAVGAKTAELRQIRENQGSIVTAGSDLLVFSYPTHGFTAPWLMIRHVFRLPRGRGVHAAVLPTRAGTRVRGVSLPGMEGTAGYLIALLLWLRGYKIRAMAAIDMPSNWTALHWGLSDENARTIAAAAEAKVARIALAVAAGRPFFTGFIPLLLGLLLARISFMYLIMGQLILAKLFFASHRCTGCALCRRICPKQAIRMVGGKPYWTYTCDSCMACMNFCPQHAVQTNTFAIFLLAYVLALPVAASLTAALGHELSRLPGIIQFLVHYAYTLAAVAFIYWALHHILRLRPVAALLARLSHTSYLRRYKAPGVRMGDIHKE